MIIPHQRMIPNVGPTVFAGSVSFTVPGTYSFVVPAYHLLTADCRGGGGGGGGMGLSGGNYNAGPGNPSYFNAATGNVIGNGGQGGTMGDNGDGYHGTDGAPGTGQNGDSNITGGGAAGGIPTTVAINGHLFDGGYGGNGGRAIKTWAKGQLLWKSIITVVVGGGGPWGGSANAGFTPGTAGTNGAVFISWS